ncbi:MAG TPA: hypothetical protein DIU35_08975 [Candidatus Latescibacteria bacterium]|nr:hypothetical protein [Gemmatimonadota bacterium]HCR17604.1 hypothetical protein [Candidatus Latescibacterota bacterium]
MQERLLDFLICPECHGGEALSVQRFLSDGDRVIDGAILCNSCRTRFPVIGGIPRLLPHDLRAELAQTHQAWFREHSFPQDNSTPDGTDGSDTNKVFRTMQSFGYQWNVFDEVYEQWHQDFLSYLPSPVKKDFFQGKTGLDAGCGMGRHTRVATQLGAELVAMDLSNAVEAAYRNTVDLPNAHVIQADLSRPPLRSEMFDFVYSFGVLHHLPVPLKGFRSLASLPKKGSPLFIWVYSDTKHWVYEQIRQFSTRIPFSTLRILCLILAIGVWICFVTPHRLVRWSDFKMLTGYMKFKRYADYPFRALYADFFDELSAPIIHGHKEKELRGWFEQDGYNQVTTSSTGGLGWRGYGVR